MALIGPSVPRSSETPVARKPELAAQLGQRADVTARLVPEPEVLAHDDAGRVQLGDQDLVHEPRRRQLGELEGERQRTEDVDAELLDELSSPDHRRQHRRMRAGTYHLGGVRGEREYHAGHTELGRFAHGLPDDLGMTPVHPVEDPYGDHAPAPARGDGRQTMPALHPVKPNWAARRRAPGAPPPPSPAVARRRHRPESRRRRCRRGRPAVPVGRGTVLGPPRA